MFNGHNLIQWAHEHLPTFLSMVGSIKQALPLQEWIKIGAVAIVTAVITSQVTLARLDERINRMQSEREILVRKRDEQVAEIKRQVERLEITMHEIHRELAKIRR